MCTVVQPFVEQQHARSWELIKHVGVGMQAGSAGTGWLYETTPWQLGVAMAVGHPAAETPRGIV